MNPSAIEIRPKVRGALQASKPVVALESTIIAHGMPYPANLDTAHRVERIVEEQGATPATIGIVEGRITVGLYPDEIELFATSDNVRKAGERDIAPALAGGWSAATTAGASMAIAAAAGICVFVTGPIGGVGPFAARDFDISADLLAIAQYPVITVCSGTKAFMDVAATLELLETLRVPVATWGTDEFPLFYTRSSGVRNEWTVQQAGEVTRVFAALRALGIGRGVLVAVPVPAHQELPSEQAQAAIDQALDQAKQRGVTGKQLTPFVLSAYPPGYRRPEPGGQSRIGMPQRAHWRRDSSGMRSFRSLRASNLPGLAANSFLIQGVFSVWDEDFPRWR